MKLPTAGWIRLILSLVVEPWISLCSALGLCSEHSRARKGGKWEYSPTPGGLPPAHVRATVSAHLGRDVGTCNCWVVTRLDSKEKLSALLVEGWVFEFRQVPRPFLGCTEFGVTLRTCCNWSPRPPHSALHLAPGARGAVRAGIGCAPPT